MVASIKIKFIVPSRSSVGRASGPDHGRYIDSRYKYPGFETLRRSIYSIEPPGGGWSAVGAAAAASWQ